MGLSAALHDVSGIKSLTDNEEEALNELYLKEIGLTVEESQNLSEAEFEQLETNIHRELHDIVIKLRMKVLGGQK